MGHLIPLRLQPFQAHTRSSSVPYASLANAPTAVAAGATLRRRPGPVTELTIFPYTELEWRKVMEEVKILHVKRQYKQCSMRCVQILESIKDPIYLSFFAASSLELTARALHQKSSAKLPMLEQSLTYYQAAEALIEFASFSTDPSLVQAARRTRKNSITSSTSSARSSMDSIFSASSSHSTSSGTSSTTTSPTTTAAPRPCYSLFPTTKSIPSEPQTHRRAASVPTTQAQSGRSTPKPKKKVSFSVHLQQPIRLLTDDELATASPSTLMSAFPNPPSSSAHTIASSISPTNLSTTSSFFLSRALTRYAQHLSTFALQVHYHVQSVKEQISRLHQERKLWRCGSPDLYLGFGEEVGGAKEKGGLRGRIEKLRQGGWSKKRFDGTKYQVLCEKALNELE